MAIVCKSPAEIEKMRQSGRVVRQVLDHLRPLVVPGATTMDLERAAEQKEDEGSRRETGLQGVLRLSVRALHLDQ